MYEGYYLGISVMMEHLFEHKLSAVINSLNEEQICELNKFFFVTYDRISEIKSDISDISDIRLKPTRILPFHQELIAKGKIGMIHRSLFSTLNGNKFKDELKSENIK